MVEDHYRGEPGNPLIACVTTNHYRRESDVSCRHPLVKYKHRKVYALGFVGILSTDHARLGIAATLQAQNGTFLALASQTAALETELQKIKLVYTQLWRTKTGSARDPFDEVDQ